MGASMGLRPDDHHRWAIVPLVRSIKPNFVRFAEMKLESLLQARHHWLDGNDSVNACVALKVAMDERSETLAGFSAADREFRY